MWYGAEETGDDGIAQTGGEGDMWPYKHHAEEDYNRVITFVQDYAVSLGAKLMVSKEEKFTTYAGDKYISESLYMNIYQFDNYYFWIEHHFLSDRPFIVFSFGNSIETVGEEDAEPFPYDLPEEELKAEVRYSLGLEKYPKI